MNVFVFASIVGVAMGQVTLPHGHDLRTLVDKAFNRLDHSPSDGVVTELEFDVIITRDDADKNGCVSYQEWLNAQSNQPHEIADKLFHHFEADGDNCLNVKDMQQEFHAIDHDNNNELSLHEFEKYYTHLVNILFGHGHGHGK